MARAVIICGPTASGKTELAHHLALKMEGEIVNADSMQLYKQLPIITASPDEELKNSLPYHLYNFQNINEELSAVKYVQIASKTIRSIISSGKLPIIVGGSGMYINMLVDGYNQMPDISPDIRKHARNLSKSLGPEAFFAELTRLDPEICNILNAGDTQRTIRAYEIIKQTGRSILEFQSQDKYKPLPEIKFEIILLAPERKFLYETCNKRLKKIFASGAIDEVKGAYEQFENEFKTNKTTAMKALGVQEIIGLIRGDLSIEQAIEKASAKTRQYAKRQTTWFKNQLTANRVIEFSTRDEYESLFFSCTT